MPDNHQEDKLRQEILGDAKLNAERIVARARNEAQKTIDAAQAEVDQKRADRLREANVRRELKRGRVNGKYTIPDTMRVSRLKWQKEQDKHLPFRKDSVSAATFEIDPEFPDVLSTAYIALGPQQHTVYLPTPMALEQFPKEIGDGSWGELAYSLRKAAGDDHDGLKRIVELEQKLFAEYDHVREQARSLLKAKRRGEAVKILNECYRRHFAAAKQLLAELNPAAK